MKFNFCDIDKSSEYYHFINACKRNKIIELTDLENCDYIIHTNVSKNYDYFLKLKKKHRSYDYNNEIYKKYIKYYKNNYYNKKEIILDFCDSKKTIQSCPNELLNNIFLYFKRSCVNRLKNKSIDFLKYNINVIPLSLGLQNDYTKIYFDNNRNLDIVCMFDNRHRGYRREIYHFMKELKGYNKFVGLVKYNKKFYLNINKNYFEKMCSSKIVLTAAPKNHEGDYRLYEALASGALVFTDSFLTPVNNKFIHKKHLIVYNNINQLYQLIQYYINNEDERKEIAKNGREYVLKYHTFDNRLEKIIEEIKLKEKK